MEIERNPKTPELSQKAIELLTELCFRKNDEPTKPVDGIFVFGSFVENDKMVGIINDLLSRGISRRVFAAGGKPSDAVAKEFNLLGDKTSTSFTMSKLSTKSFPEVEFITNEKSNNTLANVTEMLKESSFGECKSLLFIFKYHAAGRGYLTLRKFFPNAKILQYAYDTKYPSADKEITRENWHTFDLGRSRVWGEFLRIKKYGERGDIAYNEVKDLVAQIEKEVSLN